MENEKSPYYYGNEDCPPVQLILKHHGAPIITQELPWDTGLDELFDAFVTACVGVGYGEKKDISEVIREHIDEYYPINYIEKGIAAGDIPENSSL